MGPDHVRPSSSDRHAFTQSSGLPIVVLSGSKDGRLVHQTMREGAYDYLKKKLLAEEGATEVLASVLSRAITLHQNATRQDSSTNGE